MSAAKTAESSAVAGGVPVWVLCACVALGTLLATFVVLLGEPLLAIGALALVPIALLAFSQIENLTVIVLFLLYINAPTIASRFHGIPLPVAYAVPLLLGIPILRWVVFRGRKIVITPVVPLLIVFLAVQLAGALFASSPDVAFPNLLEFVAEAIVLYVLMVNAIRTPETLRRSIWALLAAGAFMGAIVFYQQVTGAYDQNFGGFAQVSNAAFGVGEDAAGYEILQPRLEGPIGAQNRFAQVLAVLLPLALFMFWSARSRFEKVAALICFQLAGIGVALAFSRGAAVGIAAMFFFMMLRGHIRVRHLALVGLMVGVVAMAVPQYAVRLASLTRIKEAILQSGGPGFRNADSATRSRLTEMMAAGLAFSDHPVVGLGPGMYRYHYRHYGSMAGLKVKKGNRESHSLYFGLAAEHGMLGLLAFAAILFVTFRDLSRAGRRWKNVNPEVESMITGVTMALITYLSIGFFLHFAFIRYFWILMALAGAASRLEAVPRVRRVRSPVHQPRPGSEPRIEAGGPLPGDPGLKRRLLRGGAAGPAQEAGVSTLSSR
jgi:hypothetical protein